MEGVNSVEGCEAKLFQVGAGSVCCGGCWRTWRLLALPGSRHPLLTSPADVLPAAMKSSILGPLCSAARTPLCVTKHAGAPLAACLRSSHLHATAPPAHSLGQVPETLPAEVLAKMGAPPKADDPIITADELKEYDGFLFGEAACVLSSAACCYRLHWVRGMVLSLIGQAQTLGWDNACEPGTLVHDPSSPAAIFPPPHLLTRCPQPPQASPPASA